MSIRAGTMVKTSTGDLAVETLVGAPSLQIFDGVAFVSATVTSAGSVAVQRVQLSGMAPLDCSADHKIYTLAPMWSAAGITLPAPVFVAASDVKRIVLRRHIDSLSGNAVDPTQDFAGCLSSTALGSSDAMYNVVMGGARPSFVAGNVLLHDST